ADRLESLLTGQGVHSLRQQLANAVFHMPPDRITVRAPDVGGGFGVKNFLYPEWVLVLWAARRLGRPVKWIAERGEEFVSSAQGRDNYTHGRLALDQNGRFAANLDEMAQRVLTEGFAARRRAAADRGKLRGLGLACFLETSRGTPGERAEIRFEPDGRVALVLGTQSNGQGHETSFPQIAADLLGLPIAAFRFVQADTGEVKSGNGHGGA